MPVAKIEETETEAPPVEAVQEEIEETHCVDETPAVPEVKVGSNPDAPAITPMPDVALWADIVKAREEERKWENETFILAEALKSSKKKLEVASEHLGSLIDNAQQPTLFNVPAKEPAVPADDDAWRAVSLEELGLAEVLSPGKIEDLKELGLTSFGLLADALIEEDAGTDSLPKGFGKQLRQKIDDCIDAYWTAHPREPKADAAQAGADAERDALDGLAMEGEAPAKLPA